MMRAVIMAGGKGSRMGGVEKAMLEVCGSPVLERELEALRDHWVMVAASPRSGETIRWCLDRDVDVVVTSGLDYSWDLGFLMNAIRPPFLVLPADLPFAGRGVREFEAAALRAESSIVTLMVRRRGSVEPVGVSMIRRAGSDWADVVVEDSPEFMDIDSPEDLGRAIAICGDGERRDADSKNAEER